MNASIRTYEDLIQDSRNPGKLLVEAAAVGFDGNLSALARSIGMSLRSLMYLKSGGVASSQASRMLLAVLANNPNGARRICESANNWMDTNGLLLTSRVRDRQRKVAPDCVSDKPDLRQSRARAIEAHLPLGPRAVDLLRRHSKT